MWQVLRANRAGRAGLGYRVHHEPGAVVHYCSAPAAPAAPAAAPDSSRSFCLSRERLTMQQLNRRLASYLQQVRCLEEVNQKLECQIQEELDRKCPTELRQLDGHLRTASLLQDQISECLSAQAQVKLQLLSAELIIFDYNVRSEKEHERHGCVEAELSDLKLLGEALEVHTLPELQSQLSDQRQQLTELQIQHQQDMQAVLAQASGGVAVEMQSVGSSDLIQQLDELRQTSVTLLDKNQSECWFNTQVSMLSSPEVTFDPPAVPEAVQAELEELRRAAASLEEELIHLNAQNMGLEASGQEQTESFMQQLVVLQQRADSLCGDLDSVLQAAAQQAEDHQTLLDVKSRLESEIQDYCRLLDGLSPQGVSSLHSNSAANVTSFCAVTSPSAFRRNTTVNKTASVHGGNLRMMGVQTVSRGHIPIVGQTPVVSPLSETKTTVQSIRVHSKDPKSSPVRSINTSNLKSSFQKSETQGTLPERTGRESMTINSTINRQSSTVGDKVHTKDRNLQMSLTGSTQICSDEAVVKASKPEINTAQRITTSVPERQSPRGAAVQEKTEMFTSKQTTTEITKTSVCAEPEVKPHFITKTTTTGSSKETAAEIKKETETEISAQMDDIGAAIQNKSQEPAQVVSLSLETPREAVRDAGEVAVTASVIPGSHILRSDEALGEVSGEREVTKASKPEINTAKRITTLVPERQSSRGAAVREKTEAFTSKQTTTEASLQATETGTIEIETEITITMVCSEPEVKQGPQFITKTTTTDPRKETAAEVKKETETVIQPQKDCIEDSVQPKNQEPAQVVSLSLETPREVAVTASVIPGSHILRSDEALGEVSGEREVTKASKPEINTAQGITTLVPDTQSSRGAAVQAKPETSTSKQTTTEAGVQATNTGTNIQTEITKTIVCAEPEVKQGPQKTTTTDSVAEVMKETETEISAQKEDTEASIQNNNQEPAQVVSLSLESPAEAVRDAGEVAVTASVIPGSHVLGSDEALGEVSGEAAVVKASKPEINTAQGITTLVPDTQPARSAAVHAKPETSTSKQTTTEAGLQANKTETSIQTEITKTIVCAEPEVKQGPQFITKTTTTDPSKETAAEVKKETETGISAQMDDIEASIQNKNQEPAQVVSLSLETPAEAVRDAGEVAVTASVIPGSHILRSDEAQAEVSGESAQMDNKEIEREDKSGEADVEDTLSIASNSEQNKVMDDATTGSFIATAPAGSPDSNDNPESKTPSTEILKKVELEINKGKVVDGFQDTKEIKVDATESDNETVNLVGQEELLSTTKSQRSVSLTDSGVALSPSYHEVNPSEARVFVSPSPTKAFTCISPETCLSPIETEVLMNMDDKVFCPVDPAEHVRSPDFLLSPNDPEMFLSPDTCLSPVEVRGCPSPNAEEEDEEVGLNLTEANAHVRPVEKYILSTKEEGQSLSFGRDQALPEEDRNRNVDISARGGDGNEGGRGNLNGTDVNCRPSSQEIDHQMGSSPGGLEFGGSNGRIIADKEEQLGFGGLYRKSVRDMRSPRDRYKDTSGPADNKGGQNLGGSPGGRYDSEDQKNSSSMNNLVRGEKNMVPNKPGNHERVLVKSASFGGTTSLGGNAEAAPPPELQGRFKRGSGDWAYYGGSLGRTSTTLPTKGSEESPSGVTPAPSRRETGRFGSKGTGWVVYGGSPGRKSSPDGGTGLPSDRKEEGPSVATHPATSTQKTGTLGSRGDGEGIVYGGSLGRKRTLPRTGSEERPSRVMLRATSPHDTGRFGSRGNGQHVFYSSNVKRSDSIPIPGSRENQPTHLPTSPPGSGRFGSSGSAEWRVYGGRMSSAAGSENLPNADREENTLAALQLATSPPGALRSQRFGSGDSGEWRVYGGSTGRLSRAAGIENLPRADNEDNMLAARQLALSPPLRSQRFGSGDSGEWRVYGGSTGRLSRAAAGSGSLPNADNVENMIAARQLAISPPVRQQRFGSGDSGEWRVYGGSSGRLSGDSNVDKVTVSGSIGRVISPPSSYTGGGPRLSSGVVRRSSSVGSGGRLSGSGSGSMASPVYSSTSGRKSTTGRSGGGAATTGQRAPSPGGRMSVGSGGWLSGSTAGISSPGSGSKLSGAGGSSDRMSGRPSARVGGSSGSGRTNSTGGRVISSSDRPIRSTGSGAGGNKERISVCKMAALSMSAAGRSQDKQRKPEPQAAGSSPLVQRWLTSGDLTSTEPDGLDDIMRL